MLTWLLALKPGQVLKGLQYAAVGLAGAVQT